MRKLSQSKHITQVEQRIATNHLQQYIIDTAPQSLFTYLSTEDELHTQSLIQVALEKNIVVCIPHVDWKNTTMHMCQLQSLEKTYTDIYGMRSPHICHPVEKADMAIVPALMLDAHGNRLGRGGGYYDRFFASTSIPIRIGVSTYPEIVTKLPQENHDIPMTHIATINGITLVSKNIY